MTTSEFFAKKPLADIFSAGVLEEETVAFLAPDEKKRLLFRADEILRVTSYDKSVTYEPGRDYALADGCLVRAADSAIPFFEPALYYSPGDQAMLKLKKPDGEITDGFFSEGRAIPDRQARVTYRHSDGWDGFRQETRRDRFARFFAKLEAGQDVTVLFYGDSITYGANASLLMQWAPRQPSYPMLFTMALAELYGYTVRFTPPMVANAALDAVPDYRAGDRGTITYVNSAVGGWSSQNGIDSFATHVAEKIDRFGCDLFALAFGMNDGNLPAEKTARNCEKILQKVFDAAPETNALLVSTMLPNPDAANGWFGTQPTQEPLLLALADAFTKKGLPCAAAQMTSVSRAVLARKRFIDYTGNNINHPNDFFSRVYACTLLQTVVGYDHIINNK